MSTSRVYETTVWDSIDICTQRDVQNINRNFLYIAIVNGHLIDNGIRFAEKCYY